MAFGFGFGFGMHKPAAGGGAWSPASLFTGGEIGDAWVASPQYLYENTTDPSPNVVDGDVVGRWVGMVNGRFLDQGTAASKPTYNSTEGAVYFSRVTGDRTVVNTLSPALPSTSAFFFAFSLKRVDDANDGFGSFWLKPSSGSNPLMRVIGNNQTNPTQIVAALNGSTFVSFTSALTMPAAGSKKVFYFNRGPSATTMTGYADGVTGTATGAATGSVNWTYITIGTDTANDNFYLYKAIAMNRLATAGEIADITEWLGV